MSQFNFECKFVQTDVDAKLPSQAHPEKGVGDTGYDLYAIADVTIPAGKFAIVPVGLTLAYLTPGIWFRIEGRSGLGFKHSLYPHFGIIDNPYRNDLGVKIYSHSEKDYVVKKGDKFAQIIFYPLIQPTMSFTDKVSDTNRGAGGLGSTGR